MLLLFPRIPPKNTIVQFFVFRLFERSEIQGHVGRWDIVRNAIAACAIELRQWNADDLYVVEGLKLFAINRSISCVCFFFYDVTSSKQYGYHVALLPTLPPLPSSSYFRVYISPLFLSLSTLFVQALHKDFTVCKCKVPPALDYPLTPTPTVTVSFSCSLLHRDKHVVQQSCANPLSFSLFFSLALQLTEQMILQGIWKKKHILLKKNLPLIWVALSSLDAVSRSVTLDNFDTRIRSASWNVQRLTFFF